VLDEIRKAKFKKRRKCARIQGKIDDHEEESQEIHLSYEYHLCRKIGPN
jgi:hypothetical protein